MTDIFVDCFQCNAIMLTCESDSRDVEKHIRRTLLYLLHKLGDIMYNIPIHSSNETVRPKLISMARRSEALQISSVLSVKGSYGGEHTR